MAQCHVFAMIALPSIEHMHPDTRGKWITMKSPKTALGRPRILDTLFVLALADIVSRVCSEGCCGAGVVAGLMTLALGEHLVWLSTCPPRESRNFMRTLGYTFKNTQGRVLDGVVRCSERSENCARRRLNVSLRMQESETAATSSTWTRRGAECCHCSKAACSPEASSTSSSTRAATSPLCSAPAISCLMCTPNFFRGTFSAVPQSDSH